MISCPPSDKYRVANVAGKSPPKNARSNLNKLTQECLLLKQYNNENASVNVCFSDGLQAYNSLLDTLFSALCGSYHSKTPCVLDTLLNCILDKNFSELSKEASFRNQCNLNKFCIDFFGKDTIALSKLVPNKKIIDLLDYDVSCAEVSRDHFKELRQAEVDKYSNHRKAVSGQDIELTMWQQFIDDEAYNNLLEDTYSTYQNNEQFRLAVAEDINKYVTSYMDKLKKANSQLTNRQCAMIESIIFSLERAYVFEEATVMKLWARNNNFTHIAYASDLNNTLSFLITCTNLTFINTRKLEKSVALNENSEAKDYESLPLLNRHNFFPPLGSGNNWPNTQIKTKSCNLSGLEKHGQAIMLIVQDIPVEQRIMFMESMKAAFNQCIAEQVTSQSQDEYKCAHSLTV